MNKLKIISTSESSLPLSLKEKNKIEKEALYERLWLQNPSQFDPRRDASSRVELDRVKNLIPLNKKGKAIDLGCGFGLLSSYLVDQGFKVDALDISQNALRQIKDERIHLIKAALPYTKLEDEEYDLVVAADVIAEIVKEERRMAISEMERVLKGDGKLIISTPIDIDAEDALIRFLSLVETEFDIEELKFSYHRLPVKYSWLNRSEKGVSFWESVGEFFWQDQAISHVIALCHKRPMSLG